MTKLMLMIASVKQSASPVIVAAHHKTCTDMQVPRSEMQAALALRFGGDGIVKMKGLPFKATADDVIK